jgi:two-component system, NarL family, nitrate/nitrite response regulator NarL
LGDSVIRLLVADGSCIHTQLLVEALQRDPELVVQAFELDSKNLIGLVRNQNIDVLVMSSTLDEEPGSGFERLRELRSSLPRIKVVMLLDSSSDDTILNAFRAGARGVISRTEPVRALSDCIRRVHAGHIWADDRQLTVAIEALADSPVVRAVNAKGMSLLSKRELQIVHCLAEGLTNREIAERLKLSQHTVKNYLFRVFDKLGVSSRVELLFMTLADAEIRPAQRKPSASDKSSSSEGAGAFLKLVESDLPMAQLPLAQLCLSLTDEPQNPVLAYAWYVLAGDCMARAKDKILRRMTAAEIEEARQQARVWLARLESLEIARKSLPTPKPVTSSDGSHPSSLRKENEKAKAAYPLAARSS